MSEITVKADDSMLEAVQDFIHQQIEDLCTDMKLLMQIDLAVEEIFVNIAHYAYAPQTGEATITCNLNKETREMQIIFSDAGKPFNPLDRDEPDVTLPAEERGIGGLGIFLTKKYMDEVSYEYSGGKNNLTLKKTLP